MLVGYTWTELRLHQCSSIVKNGQDFSHFDGRVQLKKLVQENRHVSMQTNLLRIHSQSQKFETKTLLLWGLDQWWFQQNFAKNDY